VVLPTRNGPDLEDVPEEVRQQMTFHLAAEIGEVLARALVAEDGASGQDGGAGTPKVPRSPTAA